ncbi:hypothetical protein GCM10010361_75720 [Streptomyces olivaceiscleroticus]|uniref:Uncharacterized protein n=1 Tax=Streptomyces olivaceiscleroticus TaxID=68245 RepID=A0ABN1BJ32_9ACTN
MDEIERFDPAAEPLVLTILRRDLEIFPSLERVRLPVSLQEFPSCPRCFVTPASIEVTGAVVRYAGCWHTFRLSEGDS